MDADDVEAAVGAGGFIKHALEGGPPIVCRRGSRLDKFLGDCPAPSLAKAPGQVPLRWNGDIAGRLTAGAHPQVERGSSRRERITLRRVAECHGGGSTELKQIFAGRRIWHSWQAGLPTEHYSRPVPERTSSKAPPSRRMMASSS